MLWLGIVLGLALAWVVVGALLAPACEPDEGTSED